MSLCRGALDEPETTRPGKFERNVPGGPKMTVLGTCQDCPFEGTLVGSGLVPAHAPGRTGR